MIRHLFVILSIVCACSRESGQPTGSVKDAGPGARAWPPVTRMRNPIPDENQLAGDPDWMSGVTSSWNHQIEGYTDRVSALAGDIVQVMMSADTAHAATWSLYRLGWYGGAGARKVIDGGAIQVGPQAACPHRSTGLVRCQWPVTFTVSVPKDAVSGLYLIRVVRSDHYATYPPLVVRDERTADVLFESGISTFQAYNTIYWALGVDGPQRDPRVERMTANLLQLGLGLPIPEGLRTVTAPAKIQPDPSWATDVRTIATGLPGAAGVAQLPDGTWVVTDARAHRIWKVDGGGAVTPFAGDGHESGDPRYDNVPALQARFYQPTSVLADASGNVYVADTHNCVIRKVANDTSPPRSPPRRTGGCSSSPARWAS